MESVIALLYYSVLLLFGVYLSAAFVGISFNRRHCVLLLGLCILIGGMQAISCHCYGISMTKKLYPLFTHLPLAIFLITYFKNHFFPVIFAVFTAYLCCQISKWTALLVCFFLPDQILFYLFSILSMLLLAYFLYRYVASAIATILLKSKRTILFFGSLPTAYYLFDYFANVYTNLLYRGSL